MPPDVEGSVYRVVIEPILDDGPIHYRTTIWDVETGQTGSTETVRDIFKSDTLEIAVDVLRDNLPK